MTNTNKAKAKANPKSTSQSKPKFDRILSIVIKEGPPIEVQVKYGGKLLTQGPLFFKDKQAKLKIRVGGEFNDSGDPSISPQSTLEL